MLAVLPYAGVLRNDFVYVYDDKVQIIDNPYVHGFEHLREALTTSVWSHQGGQVVTNYYRPVMTLGFLLCYQMFGPLACGFHLVSLLLHGLVVLLLYLFARLVFRDTVGAFLAASLFALHPIHVESVAWISAVTDLELTCFYLLTFGCFVKSGEQPGRPTLKIQAAMAVSFLLALLSKEQALTLVFLAVIYEHLYRGDRIETAWLRKVERYAVLVVLSVGYVLARVLLLGSFAHTVASQPLTLSETVFSALALLGQYFLKILWPVHLSAFYVFHPSLHVWEWPVLAGIAVLAVCVAGALALRQRASPVSFGIVWFLVTLAPVLNARWMGPYVLADRYLYLPSVGLCLSAGWIANRLCPKGSSGARARGWALAGLGLVGGLYVVRIATRVPDWSDDLTLISRALATEPHEFILHDALGDAYWLRGQSAPAEREWQESLRLNPAFARPINSLGALYAKQHRYPEAAAYLQRAIALNPGRADAHLNLGALYAETGNAAGAEREFRRAIAIAPLDFSAHNVLGKLYFDTQRLPEAEQQFRQSLACEPNVAALDHLGYIYDRWGDRGRAEKAFLSALALNPVDSHAHFHLGLIYASTGRTPQARNELQAARALDPRNPEILSALAKLQP